MARLDFYHLQTAPLERALPQLLEKVVQAGKRAVVMASAEARVEELAELLWTYSPNGWLPHGTVKDGFAADQPVWLTERDENPNGAQVLVLTDGAVSEQVHGFERCLDIFDGDDEAAVTAARARWATAKTAGHELHYWQQTPTGWQERATA